MNVSHFRRGIANEKKSLKKHLYLIHTWSDNDLKGAFVNLALPSLHGGSLKIKRTVPLNKYLLSVSTQTTQRIETQEIRSNTYLVWVHKPHREYKPKE